jgi:thiamine-phosphate pyrophosphorylase
MSFLREVFCGGLRTPLPREAKSVLCYVTDRRAFEKSRAPSPDKRTSENIRTPSEQGLVEAIGKAAAAGVDWIQIREKDLAARSLAELVGLAIACTFRTPTQILLNDRLDVALATRAAGVHLGGSSISAETVSEWRHAAGRTDFRIGVSCHSLEAARAAEDSGANYIFFGPVFATPSKAAYGAPQGIDNLHHVCGAVRIPVLAIGGVTVENAGSCIAAGARGIAAIRLFQESDDLPALVKHLRG